jgi:hypothetical protein
MLSSHEKNKLVDAVNTAFKKIGMSNGTKMPTSTNNQDTYAYDLWVSQQLVALANKRKLEAEKKAILAGVIFDKEKDPKPEGTKELLFHGDNVSVSVSVNAASNRVDVDKLLAYLEDIGIESIVLDAARARATTKSRPAHVFSTFLLTKD